jgi:hypothetical protein
MFESYPPGCGFTFQPSGPRPLPAEAFEFRGGVKRNPAGPSLRQRTTDRPAEMPEISKGWRD